MFAVIDILYKWFGGQGPPYPFGLDETPNGVQSVGCIVAPDCHPVGPDDHEFIDVCVGGIFVTFQ